MTAELGSYLSAVFYRGSEEDISSFIDSMSVENLLSFDEYLCMIREHVYHAKQKEMNKYKGLCQSIKADMQSMAKMSPSRYKYTTQYRNLMTQKLEAERLIDMLNENNVDLKDSFVNHIPLKSPFSDDVYTTGRWPDWLLECLNRCCIEPYDNTGRASSAAKIQIKKWKKTGYVTV